MMSGMICVYSKDYNVYGFLGMENKKNVMFSLADSWAMRRIW
jgi:hypothetical protein